MALPHRVSLPSTQLSFPLLLGSPFPPRVPSPPTPVHQCQCLLLNKPHERPCRLGAGLGVLEEGLEFSKNPSSASDCVGTGGGGATGCIRNLGCLPDPGIGGHSWYSQWVPKHHSTLQFLQEEESGIKKKNLSWCGW